ncbi:uncharacterized protein LOC128241241 [Mya arenaria]|uniref:uncharacterized protein LOC128222538 n=2 Tax=Mya arenaria TaxID=6604 RepID=UPI0022E791E7|nr:uncharacterized protein LOC128222538 [Mya arenaria]XP_052814148.1 uncharacterized protein LOC128241241 [Mya arenaria]
MPSPAMYVTVGSIESAIQVLQKLIEIMEEAPKVEGFVMDFEAGLWQALRSVFPGTQLKGCAFHWCQAVLRHVQHLGLKATYERREGAHQLIRKLLALPFLPGQHIERAFIKLKDRAEGSSDQMKELFTYVEDQWMESSLWSTTEWSVYRQTIRTNNDTEGWHRRLNFSAGRSTLQFYVLLSLLLRESKMVNVTHQLVSEAALGRQRRERYRDIDARIMDEWDSYDSHEVTCEEFLKNVGAIYGGR